LYHTICATFDESAKLKKDVSKSPGNSQPDLSELKRMANGDPAFVEEMICIFLDSSQSSVQLIDENLKTKNYTAIAELAHKLAPPLKYMNTTGVYNTAKELENLANDGTQTEKINHFTVRLKTELETLNTQLKKVLEENTD
ncbi:MAG TPA: Hpt domain-containing protein, partial [Draconibacterium sp.]|nr:Hpt domain-containing protein [Draconibacterium sp.]